MIVLAYIVYRIDAKAVESELVPIRNDLTELAQSTREDVSESDGK